MRLPYFIFRWMHRSRLSRQRLRGSLLHSWFGDRLLAKELWRPTRDSLARAWLVGFPITITPFLPVQSVFACIAALFLRGNLLLCIALQFLSTPLTAPVQLPACYFVGALLRGTPVDEAWHRIVHEPGTLLRPHEFGTLYLGALVVGVIGGILGYVILQGTWRERLRPRRARAVPKASAPPAGGEAG